MKVIKADLFFTLYMGEKGRSIQLVKYLQKW